MARHRLRKAAVELQKGKQPPGLDPECHRVRSASFVLPIGMPFDKANSEAFKAKEGVAHTSI
jgi:phthalate 4,5-dioxygenase